MRFFGVSQPPEQRTTDAAHHDSGYQYAQMAYQAEKEAIVQKQIERAARLKRLGYEVDLSTRRSIIDAD